MARGNNTSSRSFPWTSTTTSYSKPSTRTGMGEMTETKKVCPNCDGQGYYEIIPAGWVICPDCKRTSGH